MTVKTGTFKNLPMIYIYEGDGNEDERPVVQFGLKKARAVAAAADAIAEFVKDHEPKPDKKITVKAKITKGGDSGEA